MLLNYTLGSILSFAIQLVILLIIIDVVLSYVVQAGGKLSPYHPFVLTVRKITTPILAPVRRALPPYRTGGWDFSPMIVIIVLQIIAGYLYR